MKHKHQTINRLIKEDFVDSDGIYAKVPKFMSNKDRYVLLVYGEWFEGSGIELGIDCDYYGVDATPMYDVIDFHNGEMDLVFNGGIISTSPRSSSGISDSGLWELI